MPQPGDTYDDTFVESGIPFCPPDVGAPDSRGFSAPDAVFATGALRYEGGSATTRASGTGAGNSGSGGGAGGGGGGGPIDGGSA